MNQCFADDIQLAEFSLSLRIVPQRHKVSCFVGTAASLPSLPSICIHIHVCTFFVSLNEILGGTERENDSQDDYIGVLSFYLVGYLNCVIQNPD